MKHSDADALERVLEGGPLAADGGPELRALSRFAEALGSATPAADAAFKAELRVMLVEEARLQASALPRILPRVRARAQMAMERVRWSTRTASAGLAAAVALSSGGGVAVAAEHALPSSPFYGVKVALDEARAAMAFDIVTEGERHLGNADERVGEAERSVQGGDQRGAGKALELSASSTRKGARALIRGYQERGDRAIVQRLTMFAALHRQRVSALAGQLEGDAAEAARASLVVLDRIEERVVAIGGCASCETERPPRDGEGFDFSEIPPADEPFQPCPCDEGSTGDDHDRAGDAGGGEPEPEPSDQPSEQPSEDPEPPPGGPVPDLPPPAQDVDDVVNEIVRDVVEDGGEPAPATMPKGGLALPEGSEPAGAALPGEPLAAPQVPALPDQLPDVPELEDR